MTARPFPRQPKPKPTQKLAEDYRRRSWWYRQRSQKIYREWMAGASKEYLYWTYRIEWKRILRLLRECQAYEQLHGVLD